MHIQTYTVYKLSDHAKCSFETRFYMFHHFLTILGYPWLSSPKFGHSSTPFSCVCFDSAETLLEEHLETLQAGLRSQIDTEPGERVVTPGTQAAQALCTLTESFQAPG